MTFDAVYLSPHLDDAVLSCGGTIHLQSRAGRNVAVVTVFTADLEDDPSNRVLQDVFGRMHLDPADAMAVRRAEDLKACRRLGATPVHWEVPEALGRHADLPSLDALFDPPPASDDALVDQLAERLEEFEDVDEIVAPLGFGGHLDHRVVRRAAEVAFGGNLRYYEDFPYVLSLDELEARPEVEGLEPRVQKLESVDVNARVEAIEAYESQIGSLFGTGWRRLLPGKSVRWKVRRYVSAVGGERFWAAD